MKKLLIALMIQSLGHHAFAHTTRSVHHNSGQQILSELHLSGLKLNTDAKDVQAQELTYQNLIHYEAALRYALLIVLTNSDDPESPISLYQNEYNTSLKQIQKLLKKDLQDGHSNITLWNSLSPVEHGEKIDHNWIFRLKIPNFSDHIYWIIIDRQGRKLPYIYGFN